MEIHYNLLVDVSTNKDSFVNESERITDDELIFAVAEGDVPSLGELYLRHGTVVLRFLYRTLDDRDAAEDICHDVFLALPKSAGRYRSSGKARSWVLGIAANMARSHRRKRWLRAKLLRINAASVPKPRSLTPREQDESADTIAEAVNRLPLDQRQILMLQVEEGLSGHEIAEVMNINHGAVRVRLHRARAALRDAVLESKTLEGET